MGARSRLKDPLPIAVGSLLVLIIIFFYKVMLFRNLEYFGSDMYSFLRMTWSWLQDGVLLYDNVYGFHTAIHGFYILVFLFPFTYLFGAYGLFLALFAVAGVAVVAVARLREIPLSGRLAVEAALLSPLAFWVLDHPQWGFHPELMYPYFGVLLIVALILEKRVALTLSAVAICMVKEDGAVVCASIFLSYFAVRMYMTRRDSRSLRVLLRRLAASLAIFAAVFVASLAVLHISRFVISVDGTQLLSTARIGEALNIAWATLIGTGNPEWGERLRTGMFNYALIALSLGILTGRRCLAYLLIAVLSAIPVIIVLAISTAPYGFGNLFWPPRVATLLASLFGTLVAIEWAGRIGKFQKPRPTAGEHPVLTFGLPLVLIASSWAVQLVVLRSAANYSIRSRLDLSAVISGEGSRLRALQPDELRFARCLAGELPDRIRISSQGPQSPLFHRQDLSFPGIESKALGPPVIRIVWGSSESSAEFTEGFRLTVGRLDITGSPEAEHWAARCVENGTASSTVIPSP